MTTKPNYDFTACGTHYNASAETKEMLHQLVNAAGARLERDVQMWERELREAGWEPYRARKWRSPTGELYLGPYGAWKEMKRRNA